MPFEFGTINMIKEGKPKTVGRGFARQSRFSLSQEKDWSDIARDVKRLSQCCFGPSLVKGIPDLRMIYEFTIKHSLYVRFLFLFVSFIFLTHVYIALFCDLNFFHICSFFFFCCNK